MPTAKRQLPALTPEMQSATSAYLMARAMAETLKPIVRQIEVDLLKEMPINYDPQWAEKSRRRGGEILEGRITDPDHLYLAVLDSPKVIAYYEVLDARKQERFPDPARPKDHCPYLVAKTTVLEAENLMIDAASSLHGHADLKHDQFYGDKRKQMIHLILGLVINHPQFKAPKLPSQPAGDFLPIYTEIAASFSI